MGTGYTRNDTPNNIADGNVINASDLDGEFDAIQAAFNATTGHSHDGTTGEGPQIDTAGIANDAVTLGTKTSGNYIATGAVSGVGLSGSASAEGATFTVTSNATSANTASTIVARDASGNFSAGQITGTSFVTSGDMTFGDNDKAVFGAGSDLQIYHDGSNSIVYEGGTGTLKLATAGGSVDIVKGSDSSETMAKFNINGAAELYYDNAAKLATTATGADITGTLTADGLTVDGASTFVNFTSSNNSAYVRLQNSVATGGYIGYQNDDLQLWANASYKGFMLDGATNDISFYDSTGVTQGFYWDASTQRLGLGTTGPAKLLEIAAANSGASENNVLRLTDLDTAVVLGQPAGSIEWYTSDGNAVTSKIGAVYAGTGAGSSLVFSTAPSAATGISERLRIDEDGNVGIGTASVDNKLHLEHAGTLYLQIENTSTANKFYLGNSGGNAILESTGAYSMNFKTNGSEAARFDSSQNFLVGTTNANPASNNVAGVALKNGSSHFSADGAEALRINRKTSDGQLISLRKDASEVGSIGVDSTDNLYITGQTGNTGGIYMNDAAVSPAYQGVERDAYYDLGKGAARWKDAHFSGTVNATSYTGDGSSLTGIAAGATGGGSDEIFWENGQTVTTNYTITNGKNAMSAGPITINTGVTVTVGTGETWTVV